MEAALSRLKKLESISAHTDGGFLFNASLEMTLAVIKNSAANLSLAVAVKVTEWLSTISDLICAVIGLVS